MTHVSKVGDLGIALDCHAPYGTKWLFHFGAYGWTKVFVWGADLHLESALEVAAGWLADHAPGVFTQPEYEEVARDLGSDYLAAWQRPYVERSDEEQRMCDKVCEEAETDLTYTESGWIPSWEWNITEDPTPSHLREIMGVEVRS